jgi:D-alanyl-D-alanine dipeptidase
MMNLNEKLERSCSSEKIDFAKIICLCQKDPLVAVPNSQKIMVEPIWTVAGDMEGRLYARYIKTHPEYDTVYVRPELLQRLERAASALADHYRLIVRAGHRPAQVQQWVLQGVMDDYKKNHPTASDEEVLAHARMYVSDPAIKLPPHCCGAAVDIDLFDTNTNQLIDFGSPVNEDADISHLHSDKITGKPKENRQYLLKVMLEAGFSSYYAEWWHYSYGDQIWAWFYGRNTCLYGIIEKV